VAVNGELVTQAGTTVDPQSDCVSVDGQPVTAPASAGTTVWALHKPRGVTSTLADPHAKRTLVDLFPPSLRRSGRRLFPVGRLDRDSEGLILLTDDGSLAHRLTHPRYHVAKEYEVVVADPIPERMFRQWRQGVEVPALEGEQGSSRNTVVMRATAKPGGSVPTARADRPACSLIHLTLYEGRKRQIRRMVEAAGSRVVSLKRVRIGPVFLGDLPPGATRPVEGDELERLRAATE